MRPNRWQSTKLPHPWDSPGKNTGVGCHFLLQYKKVKSEMKSLSCVRLLATPWTAAYQAPPSMGFSRQECWSRLPLPSPRSRHQITGKSSLNYGADATHTWRPPVITTVEGQSQGHYRLTRSGISQCVCLQTFSKIMETHSASTEEGTRCPWTALT